MQLQKLLYILGIGRRWNSNFIHDEYFSVPGEETCQKFQPARITDFYDYPIMPLQYDEKLASPAKSYQTQVGGLAVISFSV